MANYNITYKKQLKIHQKALWGHMVWTYDEIKVHIVEANAQWCLVDTQSFKPKRITNKIKSVFLAHE